MCARDVEENDGYLSFLLSWNLFVGSSLETFKSAFLFITNFISIAFQ